MVPSVEILGVRIDRLSMADTLKRCAALLQEPGVHQLSTVNPEFVMRARKDAEFAAVLRTTDINTADGVGLLLAARLQDERLPERVPGSELVYHLAAMCARHGWRLYLLGAAPGVAEAAAAVLTQRYPDLQIAGTYAGSPAPEENAAIVERINASVADVLYVAYGAPRQDKWIARNRETLTTVRLALGVGGALDFITGRKQRAPRWLQRLGLEWLHRLIKEPWRWRRMLALPRFVLLVLIDRLRRKGG